MTKLFSDQWSTHFPTNADQSESNTRSVMMGLLERGYRIHADFFFACNYSTLWSMQQKCKSWTKALSKVQPNHWIVCFQMITRDRSIIFFASSFPFLIYPPENIFIKVKWFMLVRDENILYQKWEHYEEWMLIPNIKPSVMKEYFKYVFLRIRTFTEFQNITIFLRRNISSSRRRSSSSIWMLTCNCLESNKFIKISYVL